MSKTVRVAATSLLGLKRLHNHMNLSSGTAGQNDNIIAFTNNATQRNSAQDIVVSIEHRKGHYSTDHDTLPLAIVYTTNRSYEPREDR